MQEIKKIEGTIAHITFQSEDTGFTVMELETDGELITVVGEMAGVGEGQKLVAFGQYANHPSFGLQFKAQSYEISLPSDVNAIYAYLASGAIKGIGAATAKRIVDKFKENTFVILDTEPEKLSTIPGVSLKKALAMQQEFKKIYGIQDAIAYLSSNGIMAKDAIAIYSYFGPNTTEIVTNNPFVLCGEPCFFEFERVDELSEKFSIEYDSNERIVGGILYVLRHNTLKGHSCVPMEKLIETVSKFIMVEPEKIGRHIEELCDQGILVNETMDKVPFIFLAELYVAEMVIAQKLAELLEVKAQASPRLASQITDIETINDIRYAPKQLEAIEKVCCSNVSIITGGPGTGKTTLVKAIIALFE
ncbi:MAG: helix-hairpin-helix domain-containing protein, partial [Oscillospiraceae bacterium]